MLLILGLFLLLIIHQFSTRDIDLGNSILRSYLLMAGIAWVITEALSFLNLITYPAVLITWLSIVIFTSALILWSYIKNPQTYKKRISSLFEKKSDRSWLEIMMISGIVLILSLTLIIAIASPPNNFDSMTYHMARVVHWIQNRSVEFYPTSIPRQNHSMPFAEYLILNVQILNQSDRFANLIQWTAYGILMISASLIAAQFGVSRKGRLFAALLVATLPMAILQSSSTQNDLVTGVFCVSFAYFLLKVITDGAWIDVAFAGVSFGLALLTKGTAYLFCAAIGSTFAIYGLVKNRKHDFKILFSQLAVIILCGVIINAGFYARNYDLYANPLSTETERITVERFSLSALYTNLIRNGSVHLAVPLPELNQRLSSVIEAHLKVIDSGTDTVFQGTEFKIQYLINEDESGNFFHFMLITITIVLLVFSWKKNNPIINALVVSIVISIILFSGLLKWQPWGTRLQLPIFTLGIPIIVYLVDRFRKSQTVILILFLILTVSSLPFIFLNSTRPLVPLFSAESKLGSNRIKQFFSNRPDLYDEYKQIISPFYQDISVLHTDRQRMYFSSNKSLYQDYSSVMAIINELDQEYVGLHLEGNDWEYPIWVFAGNNAIKRPPLFLHVGVDNNTKDLGPLLVDRPEYVISSKGESSIFIVQMDYLVIVDTPTIDLLGNK